jgi:hypothetical protein
MARKTAKFLEAKKSNIPCVKYEWIDESIEKVGIDSSSENYSLLSLSILGCCSRLGNV